MICELLHRTSLLIRPAIDKISSSFSLPRCVRPMRSVLVSTNKESSAFEERAGAQGTPPKVSADSIQPPCRWDPVLPAFPAEWATEWRRLLVRLWRIECLTRMGGRSEHCHGPWLPGELPGNSRHLSGWLEHAGTSPPPVPRSTTPRCCSARVNKRNTDGGEGCRGF